LRLGFAVGSYPYGSSPGPRRALLPNIRLLPSTGFFAVGVRRKNNAFWRKPIVNLIGRVSPWASESRENGSMPSPESEKPAVLPAGLEEPLKVMLDKLSTLSFGTLTLTIHEGRVTQLEISEKRRFAG
jgi:hypothetical protein